MIKGIIFDADHTLYFPHNQGAYREKFEYLSRETGIDADKIRNEWSSIIKDLLERGVRDCRKRSRDYSTTKALVSLGIEERKASKFAGEAIDVFLKRLIKDLDYDIRLKNIIKNLGERYKLCVASDEFRRILEMKLNHIFGSWKDYFEFLVTADDTKELKPSRKFCDLSLDKFNLEACEVVFVGDSWKRELSVAKKMGLKTVLVGKKKEGEPDYWLKFLVEINDIL